MLKYLGYFNNFVTSLCRNGLKMLSKMPYVLEMHVEFYECLYNTYSNRLNLFPSLTNFEL